MQKINKRVIKSILFSLGLIILNPTIVEAKESSNVDWNSIFKKVIDGAEKIDEKINEKIVDPAKDKLGNIDLYAHDSLWLITDIPSTDPSEKRNYFFVDKNTPTIKKTYYYDKYGNSVSKNDPLAVKRIDKELYVSIDNSEETFLIKTEYNLKDFTFKTNFIELDNTTLWNETTDASFGRFADVSLIIPEDRQKEKYDTNDLKEITSILNDCNYDLSVEVLSLK